MALDPELSLTVQLMKIDKDLAKLDRKRKKLVNDRKQLLEQGYISNSNFWDDLVFVIIQEDPGVSRSDILGQLDKSISTKEMTNVLTRLRRRGQIENVGTRKTPRWFPKVES